MESCDCLCIEKGKLPTCKTGFCSFHTPTPKEEFEKYLAYIIRSNLKQIEKYRALFDFFLSKMELQKKELEEERDEALEALGLMYEQYCSKEGHLFMCAGENAVMVLEKYRMIFPDQAGRGEIKYLKD